MTASGLKYGTAGHDVVRCILTKTRTETGKALWLGLDTGGTYTDAVLLADGKQVIASGKSLTTHWDLAVGIGNAIRSVLLSLPQGAGRESVQLVSVSTTLATNAVVENRFSPVGTVLIGFDKAMMERSQLHRDGAGLIISVAGGHDATGEELEPLGEPRLTPRVIRMR